MSGLQSLSEAHLLETIFTEIIVKKMCKLIMCVSTKQGTSKFINLAILEAEPSQLIFGLRNFRPSDFRSNRRSGVCSINAPWEEKSKRQNNNADGMR